MSTFYGWFVPFVVVVEGSPSWLALLIPYNNQTIRIY
jgi:hypothetical protein